MNLIEINDLKKKYGTKEVLKGLSLRLAPGKVYTLLGKNGAGKTTFISILLKLIKEDSGEIKNNLNIKSEVGVVFQEDYFPKDLSVNDLIKLQASFFKQKVNIDELLTKFDLIKEKKQKTATLSGGQKRKLSFLLATLSDPKLLILDEPTAGMDYDSVEKFVKQIKQLKAQGKTILLITHDLYQIESFVDYILLLNDGVFEESIAIDAFVAEELYEIPKKLIDDLPKTEEIFYLTEQSVIIKPEYVQAFGRINNISDLAKFKRSKQIVDIFKRISFMEGAK